MPVTKTNSEGVVFLSERFSELKTVSDWRKAFSHRYLGLPSAVANSLAARDMTTAQQFINPI